MRENLNLSLLSFGYGGAAIHVTPKNVLVKTGDTIIYNFSGNNAPILAAGC
jgi:hypothetical protein